MPRPVVLKKQKRDFLEDTRQYMVAKLREEICEHYFVLWFYMRVFILNWRFYGLSESPHVLKSNPNLSLIIFALI